MTMFREEATSALAGFHAAPQSWSNWNLEMLVLVEGGKPENPEKNSWSKARTNSRLKPHMVLAQNHTWATLVWGEGESANTTAPSPLPNVASFIRRKGIPQSL